MKNKILIPTDFSKNAWNALCYAIALYKNERCDFYLLHAFTTSGYALESMMVPEPGEKMYEIAKKESEKGLAKIMKLLSFRDASSRHSFFAISQYNDVLGAIKNTVDKKDIEMVVMGTKGATNSSTVRFGSTAVTVMENIRNCPVLTIPKNTLFSSPKEIVFPTDYKTYIKQRELQYLINIAKNSKTAIRILHITEQDDLDQHQEENKKLLEEYFKELPYSFHTLHHSSVQDGLRCFVESRGSDMITFINSKHSLLTTLFSTPMVKSLGHHSSVPILTLHDLKN